jgi:cardiolipin synthase
VRIGEDTVRLLRDGTVAYSAMLDAIARAQREILLEMYWIGHDHVGAAFLGALAERALAGVSVCVIYDAFGSFGLPTRFWTPLVAAGGKVRQFSPISPWRRRFRLARLLFRDHRKNLVVDGLIGFAGGINLGAEWAPLHGMPWRDDAIEVRGPSARSLRMAFYRVWRRMGGTAPTDADVAVVQPAGARVHVLTNEITAKPNRAIRRTYLLGIRRARTSICVASAYFLPGPLFLHTLRQAAKRGVRVRVLVPDRPDVRIVKLAMRSLVGRLLEDGVEVYAYSGRVFHAKTAVFDDRVAIIGSHNLDALSWRFNLECNVVVEDATFATLVRESFDTDCAQARKVTLDEWRRHSHLTRLAAWLVALFRPLL